MTVKNVPREKQTASFGWLIVASCQASPSLTKH